MSTVIEDTRTELPPFGWYPDPTGLPMLRWWNGTDWTDQLEEPRPEIQPAAGYSTAGLGHHAIQ